MFKEIFTRLIRHLPSRLVHRDPLPGAQQTVNTAVPPSLSAHCLKMADDAPKKNYGKRSTPIRKG